MAMNLGSLQLQHVNRSRPQLEHSASRQSITISDDYYSLSEHSGASSSDERTTVIRYQTPPSRAQSAPVEPRSPVSPLSNLLSPVAERDSTGEEPQRGRSPYRMPGSYVGTQEQISPLSTPENTVPPSPARDESPTPPATSHSNITQITAIQHIPGGFPGTEPQQTPQEAQQLPREAPQPPPKSPKPPRVVSSDKIIDRPRPKSKSRTRSSTNSSATAVPDRMRPWQGDRMATPGTDDTPYIQFAIDQLTRDEELLGRSRDPRGSVYNPPVLPSATGAVNVPSTIEDSPPRDLEKEEEQLQHPLYRRQNQEEYRPDSRGSIVPPLPSARGAFSPVDRTSFGHGDEMEHVLLPAVPPVNDYRYPNLDFVPQSLRRKAIGLLALACIAILGLVITSIVYANRCDGLWLYDGIGSSRYFLAEYLPQLIAVLILIWLHIVLAAVQRILPFALLSRQQKYPKSDILTTVPLVQTNFLLPNRTLFQRGEGVLAFAGVGFFLAHFTVPLASSLFQTRLYGAHWKWTTVQPVAIILAALYLYLLLSVLAVWLRFHAFPTGLKWDPVSLADLLVLLRRSANLTPSPRTSGHEAQGRYSDRFLAERPASLGYWESSSHPGFVFHGIGAEPSPERKHVSGGRLVSISDPAHRRVSSNLRDSTQASTNPEPISSFDSWATNPNSIAPEPGTRTLPAFFRFSPTLFASVTALVLTVAFLLVCWIHNPLIKGFDPLLITANEATASFSNFSPSAFLYSFMPALVAMLLPLLWASVDAGARLLAPFVALARAHRRRYNAIGAEESLLLTYAADGPFYSLIDGALNRHWPIAAASAVQLVSWAIPVLAGGVFSMVFNPPNDSASEGKIVVKADPAGLGVLTGLVVVVGLGWTALFPVTRLMLATRAPGKKTLSEKSGFTHGSDLENGHGVDDELVPEDLLQNRDVRTLGGILETVGAGVLNFRCWREPRTREDLVGRLVGRGRGRWRIGVEQGLMRIGVQEKI